MLHNKRFSTNMIIKVLYIFGLITFIRSESSVSFSTHLIHRDSPTSPFYDPSLALSSRVVFAVKRSFDRATLFRSMRSVVTSIFPNPELADYLIKISIGTPPQDIVGVADTGSDMIWTQCEPCSYCFDQNPPVYSHNVSSSFNSVGCNTTTCNLVPTRSCTTSDNTCLYLVAYGDLSFSSGELATETVTMGDSTNGDLFTFQNVVFGCGHRNAGMFTENQSGVIGLGRGPFSLVSQIGTAVDKKFSYCLVPMFSREQRSSKMYFGDASTVSGGGVVSTPIFSGYPETFYYLNFQGITVGSQRVDFNTSQPVSIEGNIIIDSGTSLTLVPDNFYNRLQLAVRRTMKNIQPRGPDLQNNLGLCYNQLDVTNLPVMVAHFSGADLELDPINTFIQVRNDSICLAFAPIERVVIFGNLAQINFLVGYDINKMTVSFKRTDCMKL